MTASPKNCPKVPKKQTQPPPPVPVFAKMPCPRDQQAYGLYLEQHSQRWIADKLKCTQPTVLRGIRRMEKWLATTLPEDRGEYTATEKLRLALAKHERLMERLLKMSLREYRRSRKTIPMEKEIATTKTKNEQGDPVTVRVEKWKKHQIGRKGFIDSAAKASHEITVLAAGWLGPGNGSISMAEVMDPEERDRWDRMVTNRDAKIKELEKSGSAAQGDQAQPATPPSPPVSQSAEKEPTVNQETAHQVNATAGGSTACANPLAGIPPKSVDLQTCITAPPNALAEGGMALAKLEQAESSVNRSATLGGRESLAATVKEKGESGTLKTPDPGPPAPQYRWEDSFRQEALDYHCLKFGLPPATTDMATGIPDPFKMSPRMWIERGFPYMIHIDRSIPCERKNPLDTMRVIKLACYPVVNPERW